MRSAVSILPRSRTQITHATAAVILLACAALGSGCTATREPAPRFVPFDVPAADSAMRLTVCGDLRRFLPDYRPISTLEEFLYGPGDQAPPMLRNPQGMARHGTQLLVCDQGRPDVIAIDLATGRISSFGSADHRPRCPVDVAVDESGKVFVADSTTGVVLHYDADGTYLDKLEPPAGDTTPRPTAVLAHRGVLYVADSHRHRVERFDLATRQWLAPLTAQSGSPMIAPSGLAVTQSGTLLVADTLAGCVHRFSPDGSPLAPISRRGRGPGELVRPKGVAVSRSGLIFVADAGRQSLMVFGPDGRFQAELHEQPDRWNGFTLPCGALILDDPTLLTPPAEDASFTATDEWLIVSDTLGAASLIVVGIANTTGAEIARHE